MLGTTTTSRPQPAPYHLRLQCEAPSHWEDPPPNLARPKGIINTPHDGYAAASTARGMDGCTVWTYRSSSNDTACVSQYLRRRTCTAHHNDHYCCLFRLRKSTTTSCCSELDNSLRCCTAPSLRTPCRRMEMSMPTSMSLMCSEIASIS